MTAGASSSRRWDLCAGFSPATLTGHEPAISAIPEVRKQTQAILAEFGYGDAEIAELGRDGATSAKEA